MSYSYEDRFTDSPFVRTIWHTQSETDGCFMSPADSSWDVLVIKHKGETNLFIAGPGTKADSIFYKKGMKYLGIRFELGAFMPQFPPSTLVNSMLRLPNATRQSFWLGDVAWRVPDFENVETFVEGLERNKLIIRDPLIKATLAEEEPHVSQRSVQRHFLKTTGLTYNTIRQIERARTATQCLERGQSIQETIHKLGYTDQPHLTKALKQFMGRTPAQLRKSVVNSQ